MNPTSDLVKETAAAIARALADAYAEREEPTDEDHERAAKAAIHVVATTLLSNAFDRVP